TIPGVEPPTSGSSSTTRIISALLVRLGISITSDAISPAISVNGNRGRYIFTVVPWPGSLGGINWSSQHNREECCDGRETAVGSSVTGPLSDDRRCGVLYRGTKRVRKQQM